MTIDTTFGYRYVRTRSVLESNTHSESSFPSSPLIHRIRIPSITAFRIKSVRSPTRTAHEAAGHSQSKMSSSSSEDDVPLAQIKAKKVCTRPGSQLSVVSSVNTPSLPLALAHSFSRWARGRTKRRRRKRSRKKRSNPRKRPNLRVSRKTKTPHPVRAQPSDRERSTICLARLAICPQKTTHFGDSMSPCTKRRGQRARWPASIALCTASSLLTRRKNMWLRKAVAKRANVAHSHLSRQRRGRKHP